MSAEEQTAIAEERNTDPREGKYLTFTLADEAYGISSIKLKENAPALLF